MENYANPMKNPGKCESMGVPEYISPIGELATQIAGQSIRLSDLANNIKCRVIGPERCANTPDENHAVMTTEPTIGEVLAAIIRENENTIKRLERLHDSL